MPRGPLDDVSPAMMWWEKGRWGLYEVQAHPECGWNRIVLAWHLVGVWIGVAWNGKKGERRRKGEEEEEAAEEEEGEGGGRGRRRKGEEEEGEEEEGEEEWGGGREEGGGGREGGREGGQNELRVRPPGIKWKTG